MDLCRIAEILREEERTVLPLSYVKRQTKALEILRAEHGIEARILKYPKDIAEIRRTPTNKWNYVLERIKLW